VRSFHLGLQVLVSVMIGLPRARFSTKKGPAWTNSAATLSISAAVARSSSSADSLHQLSKMRSSMKQATSAVTSGTLPVMQKAQRRYSTTAGSVFSQAMTSTAGLRQAGAKKWVTVARSCFKSEKICAAGSELVLEVISASGRTTLRSGEDLALQGQVFRGGLDHPVAAGDVGIVQRADQVGCHRRGIGLAHLAPATAFFE
jgi:hypothetical protein